MKTSRSLLSLALIASFCLVAQALWSPTLPTYLHLAMVGNPNGMAVSWFTSVNTSQSIVEYGVASGDYTNYATGVQLNYLAKAGFHHHVVLSGLDADTKYYYRVGDNTTWSYESTFTTPPSTPREFTIGLYGDMGVVFSQDTIRNMHQLSTNGQLDWIYHVGDISYADDYAEIFPELYEPIWNMWFDLMEPTTSILPYMVLPGNHEYSCENTACLNYSRNFVAYNNRFRVPAPESGSNTNMWYSFDYANVHFVSIDTETDYPKAPFNVSDFGDQLAWLEQDLAKVDRSVTPWIIVGGHRPLYSSAIQFSNNSIPINSSLNLQLAFEPIFAKYGVDVYFCGHVHAYERQYPVYNSTITSTSYENPSSTVYIVTGTAGNIEFHETDFPTKLADWNAKLDMTDFGFGTLTVFNNTHLYWQWFESDNDTPLDSVYIIKDH